MAGRIGMQKRSSPSGGVVPRARFAIFFFQRRAKTRLEGHSYLGKDLPSVLLVMPAIGMATSPMKRLCAPVP
jgi:hypothetical protein